MWIDSRGSDILYRNECERLLTLEAGGTGHLGIIVDGAPTVYPLNYGIVGTDIILRVGEGIILDTLRHSPVVAFEVDRGPDETMTAWSVMVQGRANVMEDVSVLKASPRSMPRALVPTPGSTFVRIRTWSMTGRRFTAREVSPEDALAGVSKRDEA